MWKKRILENGFVQHSEVCPNGGKEKWQFHVVGFSYLGNDNMCSVMTETGKTGVPINERDQIFINGLWYDRKHWNH